MNTVKKWNDLLPSLALNLQLTSAQQLRLSGSRTLARPEYRELSPIISRDVVGGENVQGDENLQRTRVTNIDARWDMYPSATEILSIALFAKKFDLPIERVIIPHGDPIQADCAARIRAAVCEARHH